MVICRGTVCIFIWVLLVDKYICFLFFCYAKDKNESNEVLFIDDLNFKSEVQILGEEFVVSPAKNPFAVSVVKKCRKAIAYLSS